MLSKVFEKFQLDRKVLTALALFSLSTKMYLIINYKS